MNEGSAVYNHCRNDNGTAFVFDAANMYVGPVFVGVCGLNGSDKVGAALLDLEVV